MKYLLDSNIVIYYFNGLTDAPLVEKILVDSFNVSVITQIEFLGWSHFYTNNNLYDKAKKFIANASIYGTEGAVIQKTIELRQQHKVKTPDAIIAATALANGFTVVTNNAADFEKLGSMQIVVGRLSY